MSDPSIYFPHSYDQARRGFQLQVSRSKPIHHLQYQHPQQGPLGEPLAIDAAWYGSSKARRLLLIISGTHGLEGLLGSAIQQRLVEQHTHKLPTDTAVVFLHMLNPWGAAHGRRQNEDNIDLNRNFVNFSHVLPKNTHYTKLHSTLSQLEPFINDQRNPALKQHINNFINDYGERAYHCALFQGQYQHSDGIGFGGNSASWSNQQLHALLTTHFPNLEKLVTIDIHSGLGDFGQGLLLCSSSSCSGEYSLAKRYFGNTVQAVKSDPALPYDVCGDVLSAISALYPDSDNIPLALEFGTYDVQTLMQLQIDDRWVHHNDDAPNTVRSLIKQSLWDFFYPDSADWQQQVLAQGEHVYRQALNFLDD